MSKCQIIELTAHPRARIKRFRPAPKPISRGIFSNARQAGAYVETLAAKLPGFDDVAIDPWIVARDLVAMTYQHYADLDQLDELVLAIARGMRLVVDLPDTVSRRIFAGACGDIALELSDTFIRLRFLEGTGASYLFARLDRSFVPVGEA